MPCWRLASQAPAIAYPGGRGAALDGAALRTRHHPGSLPALCAELGNLMAPARVLGFAQASEIVNHSSAVSSSSSKPPGRFARDSTCPRQLYRYTVYTMTWKQELMSAEVSVLFRRAPLQIRDPWRRHLHRRHLNIPR